MKGIEKLTSIRLAEVLSQKGVVPPETITDALYIQDKQGDPFVEVLVTAGHLAEWDLARVVVENFQLPFILAGNYDIPDDAKERIPQEDLFDAMMVPMDLFGDTLTVSMPVLNTAKQLLTIQKKHKVKLYPYVGLISENRKVLGELFPDFKAWHAQRAEQKKKEMAKQQAAPAKKEDGAGWTDLFDSADAAVRSSLKDK